VITAAHSALFTTALCCAAVFCANAFGQEENGAEADAKAPPSDIDDEIIVIGKSPAEIRAQIIKAEEAVYDRFNEINSNDEFDIHCRQETPTGSHIGRRVCQANFWRDALADAGQETVRAMRGESSAPPALFLGEAMNKGKVMTAEMRRLALEDKEFQTTLVRLGTLITALRGKTPTRASTATVLTGGTLGTEPLPYGAAVVAQVQMGRKPWRHDLTHPTFTLAQVSGEIHALNLKCGAQEEQLPYQRDVEWTLPGDWTACRLRVEATPGTTFALYEFE
jgi:hypothetical protein